MSSNKNIVLAAPPVKVAQVAACVDTLTFHQKIALSAEVIDALRDCGETLTGGRIISSTDRCALYAKETRHPDRYTLRCAAFRGLVDLDDGTVSLTFMAKYLACAGPFQAVCLANELINAMTEPGAPFVLSTSRLDLAVDYQGLLPGKLDIDGFVGRSRITEASCYYDLKTKRITSIRIGKRAVTLRIYDKTKELFESSPDKIAVLHPIWKEGGWDGVTPVGRVEFQLRAEALKQIREKGVPNGRDARDPVFALEAVAAIWEYCANWIRHTKESSTRSTRKVNSRIWNMVAGADLGRTVDHIHEIKRYRDEGAPCVRSVFGYMRSFAVATGFSDGIPKREAKRAERALWLQRHIRKMCAHVARALPAAIEDALRDARSPLDPYPPATYAAEKLDEAMVKYLALQIFPPELRRLEAIEAKRRTDTFQFKRAIG